MRSSLQLSVLLLVLSVSSSASIVLAHGGHGNEFGGSQAVQSAGSVQVDEATAKRMGLKLETVTRKPLVFGIKTTGQIESLPNQKVAVTTPVTGTVTQLLVDPGDVVEAGQPVAVMTTRELVELRTTALDRRSEAIGSVQQAEADLRLAQQNLTQQNKIVATGIQQARTELSFAQERYDKDRSLLASGAIPRRTFLESETKLAEARAALTKAESALEVSAAQAQLQRAESAVSVAQSRVCSEWRDLPGAAAATGSQTQRGRHDYYYVRSNCRNRCRSRNHPGRIGAGRRQKGDDDRQQQQCAGVGQPLRKGSEPSQGRAKSAGQGGRSHLRGSDQRH